MLFLKACRFKVNYEGKDGWVPVRVDNEIPHKEFSSFSKVRGKALYLRKKKEFSQFARLDLKILVVLTRVLPSGALSYG